MKVYRIFETLFLAVFVYVKFVCSAPTTKRTLTSTKNPTSVHCDLKNKIHFIISHLPHMTGSLDSKVFKRYQNIVSAYEKKYLHKHKHFLHSRRSTLRRKWAVPNQASQTNQTLPLSNVSSTLSCSHYVLGQSIIEYKGISNSSKVIKSLEDIQGSLKDLLSYVVEVRKALKSGGPYSTKCPLKLTTGKKRSRKQIVRNTLDVLERLHGELNIMKTNFFKMSAVYCSTFSVLPEETAVPISQDFT